jgi:putative endonuclease
MVRERRYYVYIMASKSRVIYVGMTGFLMARVLRHKAGEGGTFTRKYRVHRLVYYHSFQNVGDAIARETAIKKWRREKKVALIRAENPDLGGFGCWVGRGGGYDCVKNSGFLTGLSARFGMTSPRCGCNPVNSVGTNGTFTIFRGDSAATLSG